MKKSLSRYGPVMQPEGIPPWALQGLNTLEMVEDMLSPEEVVIIFMCVLYEISIVFISDSLTKVTSAM